MLPQISCLDEKSLFAGLLVSARCAFIRNNLAAENCNWLPFGHS